MAEDYKIKYPESGGGCLLCEKVYAKRLKFLYEYVSPRLPKYQEILFLKRGRMFKKEGILFVGRNEQENIFIREVAKDLGWNFYFEEEIAGPTVVYEKVQDEDFAKELWEVYRSKDLEKRRKFKEFSIE